jgi:hypothetical protein
MRELQENSHEEGLFYKDVLTDDKSDWGEEQKEEPQGNELGAAKMNYGDGCISQNQSTVDSRKIQLPFFPSVLSAVHILVWDTMAS